MRTHQKQVKTAKTNIAVTQFRLKRSCNERAVHVVWRLFMLYVRMKANTHEPEDQPQRREGHGNLDPGHFSLEAPGFF